MKLVIETNSHSNIHSANKITIDTNDLGFSDEDWREMDYEERSKEVLQYCLESEMLSYWFDDGLDEE